MNPYKKISPAVKIMISALTAARRTMSKAEKREFNKWFAFEQFKSAASVLNADELIELKGEIVKLTKQKEEYAYTVRTKPKKAVLYGYKKEWE